MVGSTTNVVSSRECELTLTLLQVNIPSLMPRSTTETYSGFNKLMVILLTHNHTHSHASFALSLHGHDLCDYFLLIYDSPGCGGHSALSRSGLRDWPSSGHEEEDPLPLQTPVWQT